MTSVVFSKCCSTKIENGVFVWDSSRLTHIRLLIWMTRKVNWCLFCSNRCGLCSRLCLCSCFSQWHINMSEKKLVEDLRVSLYLGRRICFSAAEAHSWRRLPVFLIHCSHSSVEITSLRFAPRWLLLYGTAGWVSSVVGPYLKCSRY